MSSKAKAEKSTHLITAFIILLILFGYSSHSDPDELYRSMVFVPDIINFFPNDLELGIGPIFIHDSSPYLAIFTIQFLPDIKYFITLYLQLAICLSQAYRIAD